MIYFTLYTYYNVIFFTLQEVNQNKFIGCGFLYDQASHQLIFIDFSFPCLWLVYAQNKRSNYRGDTYMERIFGTKNCIKKACPPIWRQASSFILYAKQLFNLSRHGFRGFFWFNTPYNFTITIYEELGEIPLDAVVFANTRLLLTQILE